MLHYFFFFSSRRRHTRWPRDWSSDVCSSDLGIPLKTIQEKNNCEIKIEINESVTSFMLYDSTGSKWEYNPSKNSDWTLKSGDMIIFNGHDVRLNKTTIMERTNRYYPIIKEGINKFKVSGLSQYKITFDFRFKYY